MNLKDYISKETKIVNKALKIYLSAGNSMLSRAMRYSIFAGCKRLRPILVLEASKLCASEPINAMPAACAIELIHTYSLIHDDLPAMDNDDLRRGMPTNHKKYGEAVAILSGDALLTDAFGLMCKCVNNNISTNNVVKAIQILSDAAGSKGMVLGQAKDTIKTSAWNNKNKSFLKRELHEIHLKKTAALIQASLVIGAILSSASERNINALNKYGEKIGLAFQVTDDILDMTGDKALLGKNGSDKANNKLTYPALYGLEKSREIANCLINEAKESIKSFGEKAKFFLMLADYIIERKY